MADYKTTLQSFIAAEKDPTPERIVALSELAKHVVATGVDLIPSPKAAPVARISPRQAAREEYAKLAPLPRGATDAMKFARAREQAKLLTTITGMRQDPTDATTYYVPEDPEVA